jgi:phosphatidylglycerophosphatase A
LTLQPPPPPALNRHPRRDRHILFVAQGFGSGRLPLAPGTWGSLVGVGWFLALAAPGSFWLFLAGTAIGIAAGIWYCDRAEGILGRKDPGSIVLDEIVAVPLVYLSWVGVAQYQFGACSIDTLGGVGNVWWLLGIGFITFRLFDMLKPWPIRAMQRVRGGWGVVVDDLAAALCTTGILYCVIQGLRAVG